MAFQRRGQHDQAFIADTRAELEQLKNLNMGSSCFVIEEAAKYIMNSKGEWVRQRSTQPKSSTTPAAATYGRMTPTTTSSTQCTCRPIKYDIIGVPDNTIVDYRDKEIRIWCPENSAWEEFENTDTDYGTLQAFAPEGAESCKITFNNETRLILSSFAYDPDDGREYVIQTLPLAHFDEELDRWVYNGESSTDGNLFGWVCEFDWYNRNEELIDCDRIRVNLSNKTCHKTLAPYYG